VGVVGLLMFAGDYGLIYWAEQYIESGLTAVLFATLPLMTLFIARAYIPGQRITTGKLASSVLAVAGTVALFADQLRLDAAAVRPMLSVMGAVLCAAGASVVSKRDAQTSPQPRSRPRRCSWAPSCWCWRPWRMPKDSTCQATRARGPRWPTWRSPAAYWPS
jgi:drug/metabolite transporter (DMT)-like permease